MWRNILILNLLIALASLPVAQAISPTVGQSGNGQMSHESSISDVSMMTESMMVGCEQMDTGNCVDFEICISAGHTHCDNKTKSTMLLPALSEQYGNYSYNVHPSSDFISHHSELLLRPPRNA
jgi:hypothetical protein